LYLGVPQPFRLSTIGPLPSTIAAPGILRLNSPKKVKLSVVLSESLDLIATLAHRAYRTKTEVQALQALAQP